LLRRRTAINTNYPTYGKEKTWATSRIIRKLWCDDRLKNIPAENFKLNNLLPNETLQIIPVLKFTRAIFDDRTNRSKI
jgi:hypothetical protein